MDTLTALVLILLAIVFFVWAAYSFNIIKQTDVGLVETFGRYGGPARPAGFTFVWAPIQTLSLVSLQIRNLQSHIQVKTKDSQFVQLPVTALIKVQDPAKAHYELQNPEATVDALVLNVIRPMVSEMGLDELFSDRARLRDHVITTLAQQLAKYGYIVVDVLIDQPALSDEAERAFNAVLISEKHRQSAIFEAQATKISIEAAASAEAEGQRLRAQGLADARKILASSLNESLMGIDGVSKQEAIALLTDTNRIDALRVMARESSNLIILDTDKQVPVIVNHTAKPITNR